MTDSTKIPAWVALLVLAAFGAGAARAQICIVSSKASLVRAEGATELAGEITLTCLSGAGASAEIENFKAVVAPQNGVAVTNRHDGSADKLAGEAVLTVLHDGAAVTSATGRIVDGRLEFILTKPAASASTSVGMKITGVRVNAAAAGGNPITAAVTFGSLPLWYAGAAEFDGTVVIAQPTAGLKVGVSGGPAAGLQCAANEEGETVGIELKEGFAAAFEAAGQTSQNIRLLLRFADIPAGVAVRLPVRPVCSDASLTLELRRGLDFNGAGVGETPTADDNGTVTVSLTAGAGAAVYEVTGSAGGEIESCEIPLTFSWGGEDGDETGVGRGRVSVGFAPASAVSAADAAAPVPRFVAGGEEAEAVLIEYCSTTLLFPFVTNQAGFSTAIFIANTSQDAFGTETQAGSCAIDYYGGTPGGGAAPDTQRSTPVAGGEQLIFTLSVGNAAQDIAPTPEFQGYLLAHCNFRYAHGMALVTDAGIGGAPSMMYGYASLVVPREPGQARSSDAEAAGLGQ